MSKKKKILFVGAFKKAGKDGSVGGQMFACHSLINSRLSDHLEWIKLDTTADSNIPAPIYKRAWKAILRLLVFTRHLLFSRFSEALIFTADGFSFVEKGTMALLAKLFGKKVILAPRSGIIINDLSHSGFMKRFIPFVFRKVDVVICQGETWQKLFSGLVDKKKDKFVVIQNWIDGRAYFELASQRQYQRIASSSTASNFLDLPEEETTNTALRVLFLSWVDKNKGIFDLIRAAAALKKQFPNVKYQIAGDGAAMIEAQALTKELQVDNQFDFLGWVKGEDKLHLLKQSDLYILPSYFEGFPNSLMEAMAATLPVISTTVGSIPDLVEHGRNGWLYEAGDVEALTQALAALLPDETLRHSLAEAATNTIKNNNTVEVAVQHFEKLFLT